LILKPILRSPLGYKKCKLRPHRIDLVPLNPHETKYDFSDAAVGRSKPTGFVNPTYSCSLDFNAISLGVLPFRASHAVRTLFDTVWIVSACFSRTSMVSVDRLNQSGTFIASD
jgi:hypothetical protein